MSIATPTDFDNIIEQVAEAQDLFILPSDAQNERKLKFHENVGKLHNYYKDQLNSALVSTRKFEKATRYFIRALRRIEPMSTTSDQFTTLGGIEKLITSWSETETVQNVEETNHPNDTVLRSILQSFLKNVNNFRILRQLVKMEILQTLKQLPEADEESLQTRTRGEMEVLISAWTGLVNKDADLLKLEHPSVETVHREHFTSDHERACFTGVVSVLPKLIDIVNRFDYLLIKYQMGTSTR